jgi:hypothetical protein
MEVDMKVATMTIRHDELTGAFMVWLDNGKDNELMVVDHVVIEVGGTTMTLKDDDMG